MIVLLGTVWQVNMLPQNLESKVHRDFMLNGLQKLLEIMPLAIICTRDLWYILPSHCKIYV
jgi:hypothetical protein